MIITDKSKFAYYVIVIGDPFLADIYSCVNRCTENSGRFDNEIWIPLRSVVLSVWTIMHNKTTYTCIKE